MTNLILNYRPKTFEEVMGQEIIIEQIINYLNLLLNTPEEKIQPLILSGPRGTGKTTTGRLIAKYLNCDNPKVSSCNCPSCKTMINNPDAFIDYNELDAASNNGVADVEEIIKRTFHPPLKKFKIIFFDECHMLTRNASNVLLKQLEEPPQRVLYILATTEENKIIPTIRSRCKLKRFNLVNDEILQSILEKIILNENTDLNKHPQKQEIFNFIVRESHGSIRDGITLLSSVLDLTEITLQKVENAVGLVNYRILGNLLKDVFGEKLGDAFIILEKLEKQGASPKLILEQLQNMVSELLNIKIECSLTNIFEPSYYKERFLDISLDNVIALLENLIKVETLAKNNIKFQTINFALAKTFLQINKEEPTNTKQLPNFNTKNIKTQSNISTPTKATTNFLDKVMAQKKQPQKREDDF